MYILSSQPRARLRVKPLLLAGVLAISLIAGLFGTATPASALEANSAGGVTLFEANNLPATLSSEAVVGAAAIEMLPGGNGYDYWIATESGTVIAHGAATDLGSVSDLEKPIVGMAATDSGLGYWLVASDGGIFAFGDAKFFGSMGGVALNEPIVAAAASDSGLGYWLVASDGGVFAFGDAPFVGSGVDLLGGSTVVDLARLHHADGYVLATRPAVVLTEGEIYVSQMTAARLAIWDRIAHCESTGDWAINTGNGYYGGVQFALRSWNAVGGQGYPHQATKTEQIYRGELLQDIQGWGAWPVCSRKVGLR